ncbi:hypothetical protein [Paenibacillus gansuensis]|uniref:Zinc ribbon domain-containing protein n=1 Tax=Paenibacillus gansuensis TaxID=306542 RepID=A0ABW5PFB3_9BACL
MIDIIGYSVVALFAVVILGGMFLVVKASTSDSDQHRWVREIVESLFGTPAHLRPGGGEQAAGKEEAADAVLQANVSAGSKVGIEPGSSGSPAGSANPRNPGILGDLADSASFEEDCPACGERVTHRDAVCPSCELALK